MPNQEIRALKEALIRMQGEIGAMREDISEVRTILRKKQTILYGDGSGTGLVSRVGGLHDIVKGVKDWQSGWREVTNYDDFRNLKNNLKELDKEVDGLKKYVYIGIGGMWIITIILQLFGPYIVTKAEAFFR